jgi:outer membrane receptor for ferrienterochelin and colicin
MKTIGKYLLCASLIAAVGCTFASSQRRQDSSKKTVAAKEDQDDDDAPATPTILPAEELNSKNAHEQADAMHAVFTKELGDMKRAAADKE